MVLNSFAKAILEFLPHDGTATVRAMTYNLNITEDEARDGLYDLMVQRLVEQARPETFFLTSLGLELRSALPSTGR